MIRIIENHHDAHPQQIRDHNIPKKFIAKKVGIKHGSLCSPHCKNFPQNVGDHKKCSDQE